MSWPWVVAMVLAGGCGAVLRHLAGTRTLGVNVLGSFAAGFVGVLAPGPWALVLATGLLGGLTTFSTAALESAEAGGRQWRDGLAHALGMLGLCIVAAWTGTIIGALLR